MARQLFCDVCKKQTTRIVAKLHYVTMNGDKRTTHSDYTHHCDVGECCGTKLLELFSFRTRMTRKEYNDSRKGVKV